MASNENGSKKPAFTKVWDDPKTLVELCVGLYQALDAANAITPQVKESIPAYLEAQGTPLSWGAIRQHIQKLRKTRDTSGITGGNGGTPKLKKTPAKKTPDATLKKRTAAGAKKSKSMVGDDDEAAADEEFNKAIAVKMEDMDESPAKKVKKEVVDEADSEES